ncbi:DUF2330 domain-containing protein [soil metagenome]
MKKNSLILLTLLMVGMKAYSFCGFYVARADVQLLNKTSQVILVRDGEKTTVTMSSDFEGNVKDFAMVIPVPIVLSEKDIRVVERSIFDQLDSYSGPRLVEYWDPSPCRQLNEEYSLVKRSAAMAASDGKSEREKDEEKSYNVQVVAKYTVGEYDIMILNAMESGGLERWLKDKGYKIPPGAKEVLEPYIKSNMKFFVVKVNLEEQKKLATQVLRPIQITFSSKKFMLPIRLGMANGEGSQDMIIYSFTRGGRIETTNYRTVKMPSDRNVPEFIQQYFGKFYVDLYRKNLQREGHDNVFLEYAWDLSGQNSVKCDPCASQPPMISELNAAGVNWVRSNSWGGYDGAVFFTRLHVTYDRENFPQDLVFQETPNREQFQCRYIINHPANRNGDCSEWRDYAESKKISRKKELRELTGLTGWDVSRYWDYPGKFQNYQAPPPPDENTGFVKPAHNNRPSTTLPPDEMQAQTNTGTDSVYQAGQINQTAFNETRKSTSKEANSGWSGSFGMVALVLVAGLAAVHKRNNV